METTLGAEQLCVGIAHKLGRQAVQCHDIAAHNQAVRTIATIGFRLAGSSVFIDCAECNNQVSVWAHALVISPLN